MNKSPKRNVRVWKIIVTIGIILGIIGSCITIIEFPSFVFGIIHYLQYPPPLQIKPSPTSVTLKILGSVPDLNGYCQSIGDQSASLDGNTVYDWRCVTFGGQHNVFSFTDACRWQYKDQQAEDRVQNYSDPYSWQCFTNAKKLGGVPDLDGYCRSIGDQSASLDGNTAYDWRCVTSDGQHNVFSFTDACRWQYKNQQAEDRMVDYSNPDSWECWG